MNDNSDFGRAEARASSKTNDHGWAKSQVTELDLSGTIFRLEKVAGEDIQLDVFKAAGNARYETFQIGRGGGVPKFAGFEVKVNVVALEGKAWDFSGGLGIDSKIGVKDKSFDLKLCGTGIKVGTVMGVSFLGSEFNVDFEKIDWKKKVREVQNLTDKGAARTSFEAFKIISNPFGPLIWLLS